MSAVGLILPAAGSGSRLGGAVPKQVRLLAGRPVLCWALAAFAPYVDEVVIPTSESLMPFLKDLIAAEQFPFHTQVIIGGDNRQDSVANGLAALPESVHKVLVHDAARPLITGDIIANSLAQLDQHQAVVVAIPCSSTLKLVNTDHAVTETKSREGMWLAQTPQGFHRASALAAYAAAGTQSFIGTDDAQVMEQAGVAVQVVPGHATNIKITTADDWDQAEALLAWRLSLE